MVLSLVFLRSEPDREAELNYITERVHTQPGASPVGRPRENRRSRDAWIVGSPRVGGVYHRCAWRAIAW